MGRAGDRVVARRQCQSETRSALLGELAASGGAEALLHVQRLPLEAGVLPEDRLHGDVGREQLGRDVPCSVQAFEELVSCASRGSTAAMSSREHLTCQM